MLRFIIPLFFLSVCSAANAQILKKPIPDKLVVLTFDDATASQYSVVAPLLKEFGFGATFFVCEFPTKSPDRSAYMNWQEIDELDEMGFEVASHTRNHINVGKVPKAQFIEELRYIEDKCDSLGIDQPLNFAYPGYGLSAPAMETLREEGYKFARAGGSRPYDPQSDHPFLLPSWATNADNKAQIMSAFGEARNGKIVILTIHGVPDVEHPWVDTPPALFKAYLQYLSAHHFKVISIRDLNTYINVDEALETIIPDLNKSLRN